MPSVGLVDRGRAVWKKRGTVEANTLKLPKQRAYRNFMTQKQHKKRGAGASTSIAIRSQVPVRPDTWGERKGKHTIGEQENTSKTGEKKRVLKSVTEISVLAL